MRFGSAVAVVVLLSALVSAQEPPEPPEAAPSVAPDPEMKRPIAARDSVFIEELTWLEVRDALREGRTTAILPTGGVSLSGPFMALGRPAHLTRALARATAQRLGDALVAPQIAFLPSPGAAANRPPGLYPGAVTVSEATYCALLEDAALNLRVQGFEYVALVGAAASAQDAMQRVAARLAPDWGSRGMIFHVPEFAEDPGQADWLVEQGLAEGAASDGGADGYATSAMVMSVDPAAVRMDERLARGLFSVDGVSLAPAYNTIALGQRLIERRAEITAAAIRRARGR